ncbi:MAG: DinB family protein [Hymenobacter sp.]|nr:MAG: DinB family protein [Hymenobacter sp.]
MEQLKWFDRSFTYPADPRLLPSLLERLMGTPARLEEKLATLLPAALTERVADTWTIQENVGHLADLEPLWQGRLTDILAGAPELRPTDLLNQATSQANHNTTPLAVILTRFRKMRAHTVQCLNALQANDLDRSARHPRLHTPMRIPDLFLFVAEHDDHHLARITALARQLATT